MKKGGKSSTISMFSSGSWLYMMTTASMTSKFSRSSSDNTEPAVWTTMLILKELQYCGVDAHSSTDCIWVSPRSEDIPQGDFPITSAMNFQVLISITPLTGQGKTAGYFYERRFVTSSMGPFPA
jgi:hypothetical protein